MDWQISFECHMPILLNILNPTNLTDLSDLTSDFRENSTQENMRGDRGGRECLVSVDLGYWLPRGTNANIESNWPVVKDREGSKLILWHAEGPARDV